MKQVNFAADYYKNDSYTQVFVTLNKRIADSNPFLFTSYDTSFKHIA